MAGKSDIKAGRAYVELASKDTTWSKGLAAARQKLTDFGSAMLTAGKVLGVAGFAAAGVSLKAFVDAGSDLKDMSDRTGLAVESLAELKYAAEQSGAGVEEVEKALRKMAKDGLDVSTFDQVAASINAIQDPTLKAQKAMEVWGKSGTALLPMLGSLQELRQEARDLGIVMSGESAASAEALGDMFSKLWTSIKQIAINLGAAVAPVVEMVLPPIQRLATMGVDAIAGLAAGVKETIGPATEFLVNAWATAVDVVGPIIGGFHVLVSDAFTAISDIVTSVWNTIGEGTSTAWNSVSAIVGDVLGWLSGAIMTAFSALSFAIKNWQLVAQIAFKSAQVAVVTFANQTVHLFSEVIPKWLDWFGQHWHEVFLDIVNFTGTVASNIWKNLSNLWDAIIGLFNGEGFNFEFTGLTEGFESVITELPKIAERQMGPLEKELNDELNALMGDAAKKWEEHQKDFGKRVTAFTPVGDDIRGLVEQQNRDMKAKAAGAVDEGSLGASKKEVFATFSAAAAAGQSRGDNIQKQSLGQLKIIAKNQQKLLEKRWLMGP